jgi:hypothetical protein
MGYATIADVQDYFQGKTFETDDPISLAQVNRLLVQYHNKINSDLRRLTDLTIPLTDAQDIEILKKIEAMFVAGEVDEMDRNISNTPTPAKTRDLIGRAKDMLNAVITKQITLNSTTSNNVAYNKYDSKGNLIEPTFKKDTEY